MFIDIRTHTHTQERRREKLFASSKFWFPYMRLSDFLSLSYSRNEEEKELFARSKICVFHAWSWVTFCAWSYHSQKQGRRGGAAVIRSAHWKAETTPQERRPSRAGLFCFIAGLFCGTVGLYASRTPAFWKRFGVSMYVCISVYIHRCHYQHLDMSVRMRTCRTWSATQSWCICT